MRALILCCLLSLTACGLHPMYGRDAETSGHSPVEGNLAIDNIPGGRMGQLLKNDLSDRFNPESLRVTAPRYRLQVTLRRTVIPAVVKSDGTIQRYDLRFDSHYILMEPGKPAPLATGDLRRTGSYNVAPNANFATYEAEQDLTQRTLEEMSEDYLLRINGFFAGHPDLDTDPVLLPKPAAAQ